MSPYLERAWYLLCIIIVVTAFVPNLEWRVGIASAASAVHLSMRYLVVNDVINWLRTRHRPDVTASDQSPDID